MASEIKNGGKYYILNFGGASVLDLAGGSGADGTSILGWAPHYDNVARNRVWQLNQKGDYWEAKNLQGQTAMTLKNGSVDNGTPIVGERPYETDRQRWKFQRSQPSDQTTYWTIINKASNTVVDLNNGDSKDGTKVQGWQNGGNWHQRWILVGPVN